MGKTLWYSGLMALAGLLIGWVIFANTHFGGIPYDAILGGVAFIMLPLMTAFAIIGWLWGSKK